MDLFLGVISFTGIVTILVLVILFARSQLVSSGNVSIIINDDDSNKLVVKSGAKLLQTLAENKIFLSSVFKKNKNYLGINRFKLISNFTKKKVVALGGISSGNLKKIKLLVNQDFAGISFFE